MANGDLTPLQLTAGAGLLQNPGVGLAPSTEFPAVATEYEILPFIADLLETLSEASAGGLSGGTILQLLALGSVDCPALADSIPAIPDPDGVLTPSINGFIGNLPNGTDYLSNTAKFAQAFASVEGYIAFVNLFINSANAANNYIGPTFTNLDNMITADLTKVTDQLQTFGRDIRRLGQLINLADLPHLGEPAALLQQLVLRGKALLPSVNAALRAVGLSQRDINDLITDNRQSLFNPAGLTENQFGKLQQQAYQGMTLISGDVLLDVLEIFDVTTPGIDDMTDLFDPQKIFPTSYPSLKFNSQPIYVNNSVNSSLAPVLNATTPTGCDELGKITSPNQAVANKALQFSLQQVSGIQNLTLPELAAILV
jgi:hypothetical protein